MSWWIIAIIFILFFIALGFGCWYFISAWNYKSKTNSLENNKKENKIKSVAELQKKDFIKFEQVYKLPKDQKLKGIYSLYVGPEINEKDFFIPIFIVKSKDIVKDIKRDENNLLKSMEKKNNDIYEEVISYLEHNKKSLKDIRWSILEIVEVDDNLDEKFDFWLIETKAKKRGFNK